MVTEDKTRKMTSYAGPPINNTVLQSFDAARDLWHCSEKIRLKSSYGS